MKKLLNKFSAMFLTLALMLPAVTTNADAIWQTREEVPVTKGVTLIKDKIFTDAGWQKCNIICVDLSEPTISLTTLFDSRGVSYLNNIKNMANEDKNVVAAINADFFDRAKESGHGSPLGLTYKDSEIISSPSHDKLPAVVFTEDNKAIFSSVEMNLNIIAPNGNSVRVLHVNKYHPMESIVMYTPAWGKTTPGTENNNVIELVAADGKVTEIRQNMPPTEIPENGFVLATSYEINRFFTENFVPGDEITVDMTFTPNIENITNAVGGGSTLVKDGSIADFEMNITGNNPRSAIGIDKSGKKLYLVAVDGRLSATPGLTQNSLASYLISLGIYNALNFDGGGSTTLVAKTPGVDTLQIINTPSGGSLRAVATGFAVKSTPTPSAPAYLKVTPSSETIFTGDAIELWSYVYDEFWNNAYIENPVFKYEADDGGRFEGNKYYPKTPGIRTVKVTLGKLSAKVQIRVLDKINELTIYPDTFTIKKGETVQLSLIGKDPDGFSAPVSNNRAKWTVSSNNASVTNGTVTATSSESFFVSATLGDAVSYANANISSGISSTYGFEKGASFYGYPDYVKGEYSLDSENAREGKYAGKLSFDFTGEGEGAGAAHASFGKDIPLGNTEKIGIWVKADKENGHWLRAQIDLPGGEIKRITLADKVDWDGYQYLEAKIPEDARGGYLSKIYLVQSDVTLKNSGTIYIDDLSLTGTDYEKPENPQFYDRLNSTGISSATKINILPQFLSPECLLDLLLNRELEGRASSGEGFVLGTEDIKKYSGISSYTSFTKDETLFITIDNSKGGIRATDASVWHKLMKAFDETKEKNVVILLSGGLEDGFKDKEEYSLFLSQLNENFYENGKNVFVVSSGDSANVTAKDGIRFITIPKRPSIKTRTFYDDIKKACYLSITVKGDKIKYEFLPIATWN